LPSKSRHTLPIDQILVRLFFAVAGIEGNSHWVIETYHFHSAVTEIPLVVICVRGIADDHSCYATFD
jgi:hypothetical protein